MSMVRGSDREVCSLVWIEFSAGRSGEMIRCPQGGVGGGGTSR